jgi:general secretion pathway protein K
MERERGSVLVSVLALAALLGVLAAIASTVVHAAFGSSRTFADNIRAEVAARSAVEQLIADSAGSEQIAAYSTLTLGNVQVLARATDEAARVDLNSAPLDLIAGVFRIVGVEQEEAQRFAARVVDWRDENDRPVEGGAERDAYRGAGRVDGPGNRPFAHVAELSRVLGIPVGVAAAAAPYFTVASRLNRLNPMLAEPILLLALPGVSSAKAQDFLKARDTLPLPFDKIVTRLGAVEKYVTDDQGAAVKVDIDVALGPGGQRHFEAIVARGDKAEPYRVVGWQAGAPPVRRELP